MEPASVMLVITLLTGGDAPDIRQQIKEPSLEQCWIDAKEFVDHGVPDSVENAVGVMAACAVPKTHPT